MKEKNSRIVIAIDGLAGSGKSTISRLLAQRLGYAHLNTGLLYRAVALICIRENLNPEKPAELLPAIAAHRLELDCDADLSSVMRIDGDDVTARLQAPEVSEVTSRLAKHPEVREALRDLQRDAFPGHNLVAEGRDMGTVIFPDAQIKFFIEASQDVRVSRRLRQLSKSGSADGPEAGAEAKALKNKMEVEIVERDRRDAERSIAPAKAAIDAIIVDNSTRPLDIVIDSMYDTVLKKVNVGIGQAR